MKEFSKLTIKKQSRKKSVSDRISQHIGFDTETFNGKLYLLCYSDGTLTEKNHLLIDFNNDDNDKILNNILKFLTNKKHHQKLKWFYNIDYDFRAIIRWLPEEKIFELYNNNKTEWKTYKISYLPKKYFTINTNKANYTYYDISQFYRGGLDKNAKKYLNEEKDDTIDSKILGGSKQYWKNNINDIIKYCYQDCKITAGLADIFYKDLWITLQLNPKKPYSAGSISQQYFIDNTYIPILKDIPNNVLKLHQDNYRGGRIEILKRGSFHNIKSYDIKSAYPSIMIDLLDYTNGFWKKTIEYDEKYTGIYEIEYNWYHDDIGLFPQTFMSQTIYPNGEKLKTVANEQELIFLDKYSKYGDYKIISGYQFIPYNTQKPFKKLIEQLYKEKENTNDLNKRNIYKLFINSIYGKTAQAIYDKNSQKYITGNIYNPIYANRITSLTRLKLLNESLQNNTSDIVGFCTDSILTTGKIKNTGDKLGDFELEYESDDSCIIMSGIRYIGDYQKTRGFSTKLRIADSNKIYSLKEILHLYQSEKEIPIKIEKPVTIFQGLQYNKYSVDDINNFKTNIKILDINGDSRRIWLDDFTNCLDCLNRNIDSNPTMI